MSESKEVILEAKHVTRRFRTTDGRTLLANNDVNLKFYKGETLGLVGESGCGKSTFMKFLVSLDIPSEGEILYRGRDITKLKGEKLRQNRQNIQMVFQDPTASFNPKMKIRDIICEPLLENQKIRKRRKLSQTSGTGRAAGRIFGSLSTQYERWPETACGDRPCPGSGTGSDHHG